MWKSKRSVYCCFLSGLLLIASFLVFFSVYDPYEKKSGNFIENGDFSKNVMREAGTLPATEGIIVRVSSQKDPWRSSGKARWGRIEGFEGSGGMRLDAMPGGGGGAIEYVLENPKAWNYLRVVGRVRSEGVKEGERPWNKARLLLFFRDRKGRAHWEHPHSVCDLEGNTPWKEYSKVFEVPDYAVTAHVVVINAGVSGTVWVDDLSLAGVELSANRFWWRTAAGIVWGGIALLCIIYLRLWGKRYGRMILLFGALFVGGVLCPGSAIEGVARIEKTLFEDTLISPAEPGRHPMQSDSALSSYGDKWEMEERHAVSSRVTILKAAGHMFFFFVISFFAGWAYKAEEISPQGATGKRNGGMSCGEERKTRSQAWKWVLLGSGLALFGGATEVLQFLTETRSPRVGDWLLDMMGAAVGLTAFFWVDNLRRARGERNQGRTK